MRKQNGGWRPRFLSPYAQKGQTHTGPYTKIYMGLSRRFLTLSNNLNIRWWATGRIQFHEQSQD
jgi:hypothetical protein